MIDWIKNKLLKPIDVKLFIACWLALKIKQTRVKIKAIIKELKDINRILHFVILLGLFISLVCYIFAGLLMLLFIANDYVYENIIRCEWFNQWGLINAGTIAYLTISSLIFFKKELKTIWGDLWMK